MNFKPLSKKSHKNNQYDDDLLSQCTEATSATLLNCNQSASSNNTTDKFQSNSDYLLITSDDSESNSSINNDCSKLLINKTD